MALEQADAALEPLVSSQRLLKIERNAPVEQWRVATGWSVDDALSGYRVSIISCA